MLTIKFDNKIFTEKAIAIHGDRYDYSLIEYVNARVKIKIICDKHGVFTQSPHHHLAGSGCQKCANEYTSNKISSSVENFIIKAIRKHGKKFDYSLVEYTNNHTKVNIICLTNNHGIFSQIPAGHLVQGGCPKCRYTRSNTEEFIEKSMLVHGDKYDYSNTNYVSADTAIVIICPKHSKFRQTPHAHLKGHGCPKCKGSISKLEQLWLDSLNIPDDREHRQVWIRIDNKKYKVDAFDPATKTVYEFWGDYWHGNPKIYSPDMVHPVRKITFGELYENTQRKRAAIQKNFKLIEIWESDFSRSHIQLRCCKEKLYL